MANLSKGADNETNAVEGVGIAAVLGIGGAQAAGDVAAGKAKAAACAGCHGANGEGIAPNPALAGKSDEVLAQAMKDYKSGKRDNAVMKGMVGALTDGDKDMRAWQAWQRGQRGRSIAVREDWRSDMMHPLSGGEQHLQQVRLEPMTENI
jgi:cytochrome c553